MSTPVCVAAKQSKEPMEVPTVRENTQDFPLTSTAKLAVPERNGVPVIAKDRVPAPLARVPASSVAVSPSTPEDRMDSPL